MRKILTLNAISNTGLSRLPRDKYEVSNDQHQPDAIMLRSHKLKPEEIAPSVKAIARAGAGVNNIPVDFCTDKGIVVFNTPGANANAVKELVIAGMILGSRGIFDGIHYANQLDAKADKADLNKSMEAEKKRFKGSELAGKTLGVVGLGAIGSMVANAGLALEMNVLGYDPALSVEAAWRLSNNVQRMENLASLFARADYISLHLPVLDATRGIINAQLLVNAKSCLKLLNFSREEIVDTASVVAALNAGQMERYITDFPTPELIGCKGVILMPHIGASTDEAEENCAIMAADQLKDFLESGNIKNSVNFPALSLERSGKCRLAITNRNVPKMLGSITNILADENINVVDLLNKSRGDVAYNLIDLELSPNDSALEKIRAIDGVVSVRVIC